MKWLAALCALSLPAAAQDIPRFTAETASAGITHAYTGEWEFMVGGGAAIFDCNGDALPDVYIAGGRARAALYVNRTAAGGALQFEKAGGLVNMPDVVGAYPINIDGDGIPDLVVLRVG